MAASGMRLAKRLDEVGFSDIVQVRNKVMELRAAGQTVHAFHGGEPFFDTSSAVKYALLSATVENKTRYAPSSGIEPLRLAIATKLIQRNGMAVSAENVIVAAGGAHALYVAFQALLDPGDDVLLFSPYWTPIREMITVCQGAGAAGADRNSTERGADENAGRLYHAAYAGHLLQHAAKPNGYGVFSRRSRRGGCVRDQTRPGGDRRRGL